MSSASLLRWFHAIIRFADRVARPLGVAVIGSIMTLALSASGVLSDVAFAADYPVMSHSWKLQKKTWGAGSCAGKSTWIYVWTTTECAVANDLGYVGSCDPYGTTTTDHYVSLSSFPGMTKVYRLSSVQLGCKDSYVLTASESRKSTLISQGWTVEKEVWAWPPTTQTSFYSSSGLVPVWHGYSSSQADNFYTEMSSVMTGAYSQGYTYGFAEEPVITDPHTSGWPAMSVAYVAADGYINLTVGCVVPGGGSCSWNLTGPGGWTKSGSGNWSAPKAPSHIYSISCNDISGLKNVAPNQTKNFEFFKSQTMTCTYECDHKCSYVNQKTCVGSSIQTCQNNSYGCREWSSPVSCEDGNPCTTGDTCSGDACQPGTPMNCTGWTDACNTGTCVGGSCTGIPKSGACNDNNPCTTNDTCQGGTCQGIQMTCPGDTCNTGVCSGGFCTKQPKSGTCNADNDACTENDTCSNGQCIPGPAKSCTYLDGPCIKGVCSAGNCITQNLSGSCNDGNPCTIGDACSGGQCIGGAQMDCKSLDNACQTGKCQAGTCVGEAKPGSGCDDGIPCTADSCNPVNGCTHTPQNALCNDGVVCTTDLCDLSQGCVHPPKDGTCTDDNLCTVGDTCAGGVCVPGALKGCDDANPCTDDSCDTGTGACINLSNSAPCDDKNACTEDDVCAAKACKGSPLDCDDDVACTQDTCDPASGCVNSTQGGPCDDGNPCTLDVCDPVWGCNNTPEGGGCTDGDPCTVGDLCEEGICVSGAPKACTDGLSCTADTCEKGKGCVFVANVALCDDGVACTIDACDLTDGCVHTPGPCDDGHPCTKDTCDLVSGCVFKDEGPTICNDNDPCTTDACTKAAGCTHAPASGVPCNDGSVCTIGDICADGTCKQGGPKCNDANPCTADLCDPVTAECSHEPLNGPCDDGDPCTLDDQCVQSQCKAASTLKCNDSNPCTTDSCKAFEGCNYEPNTLPCSDGNPCTEGDACKEGVCAPGPVAPCDDGNPCTTDSCNPANGGCVHDPAPGDCNDGNPCTTDDKCTGTVCKGTATADCCLEDADCLNPNPSCLKVTCVGGQCVTAAYCAEGTCGPNPCDESISCGTCFDFETCVSGACYAICSVGEKSVTRCVDDGKVLEKCQQDAASGLWFWKPTDCLAAGETSCAYSEDKKQSVCCTPDCTDKECGTPSACGVSCGLCDQTSTCCQPGDDCAKANVEDAFQCIDCCAGIECGESTLDGCKVSCGSCGSEESCKDGTCISDCEKENVDLVGRCAGNVAWWCEQTTKGFVAKSVDCADNVAVCCTDDVLGHVGCCTCDDECAEKGWACGTNSCGQPCGDYDGDCGPGFDCVEATRQCLCVTPELCCGDECQENGWACGTDSCGQPCGDLAGACADGLTCDGSTHQCSCEAPGGCGETGDASSQTSDAAASVDASDVGGTTPEEVTGCQCRTADGALDLRGGLWTLLALLGLLILRTATRRRDRPNS